MGGGGGEGTVVVGGCSKRAFWCGFLGEFSAFLYCSLKVSGARMWVLVESMMFLMVVSCGLGKMVRRLGWKICFISFKQKT